MDDGDKDDDDDDEVISQGRRSNSRTPPTPTKKDGGVRLSVTSPPPAFAGALSPPASVSVISPFGSPSGWIGAPNSGANGGAAAGDVHINGDHVTQVRVDAIVLKPESSSGGVSRTNQPQADADGDDGNDQEAGDRDQSELVVTTRLPVSPHTSSANKCGGSGERLHVTAVQVEHAITREDSS